MYPDQTKLLYAIQRSNIQHQDRAFVIAATQAYYKELNKVTATKAAKKEPKTKKEVK